MARIVTLPPPDSAASTDASSGGLSDAKQELFGSSTDGDSLTRNVVIEKYEGAEGSLLSETSKNCVHECVRPADYERPPFVNSRPPAKKFSYKLDPFQEAAIQCLELGESVLVAAHTSAGKTTVAEYAIAMALRDGSRVVYTSPIKALSNQKYRDLAEQFGDVGLMTGDVTLNPEASVIIMTTEILRSILYRGSELVREVRWVVFDEIHYMRDRDRGVVWEESIILLPDSVRQVFLSATIPNTLEFAEWICRVKHQPCHVISTNYRPTPLQHFVFPQGADGVLMVMDEMRNFKEDNFRRALSMLKTANDDLSLEADRGAKKRKLRNDKRQDNPDLAKVIGMCHQREYTPVIVFAFSKLEVEENARLLEKADLTTDEEKAAIQEIFINAVNTLGEEDQKLPQINAILPMLLRGIGIHHGGLLPMVKEITELLFQEMLIKVLFSTETFSMGINMPARTVIFSALKKWDGQKNRMISPGEYIQMSGRAGRRGLDDRGLSIVMVREDVDADELKSLFTGSPLRLDSHFYLKYNTLLNLLRVDGADPRYMLQRSFFQFQREKKTISLEEELKAKEIERRSKQSIECILTDVCAEAGLTTDDPRICLPPSLRSLDYTVIEEKVADFFGCVTSVRAMKDQVRQACYTEESILRFFQRGRIVHVVEANKDWGYGIVLSLKRERVAANPRETEPLVNVLLECHPSWDSRLPSKLSNAEPNNPGIIDSLLFGFPTPRGSEELGQYEIFPCRLETIMGVTTIKANIGQSAGTSDEFKKSCGLTLQAIRKQVGNLPYLNPITELKHPKENMERLLQDDRLTLEALQSTPLYGWKYAKLLFNRFEERIQLDTSIRTIESALQTSRHPQGINELRGMEEVLRRLGYIDDNNIVTFKGRVACDISTVDELIIGEILFDNVKVSELDISYLCAMLSCLVHEDKPDMTPPQDPKLAELFLRVQEVAKRIATISIESRLELDQEKYMNKFCPALMEGTLLWMKGEPFSVIAEKTTAWEGSVVRSFRRLEEVLRDLASASKALHEEDLEGKFTEALKKLKRGIVFAASLYL